MESKMNWCWLIDRSSTLTEGYGFYDPSTGRTIVPNDGSKSVYEDVIVFIVGGGNYSEYQHLQVYAKSQNPSRVVLYGSTDILPANQVCRVYKTNIYSSYLNYKHLIQNRRWTYYND